MKLRTKNLSAGYSGKKVLKDINLEAQAGDFIVLLGKNGAGKSTFIKSVSGIIPVLEGDIELNGNSLLNLDGKKRAELIGVVLTDRIDTDLSVYEFIALGRQIYTGYFDILSKNDHSKIEQILIKLQLKELRQRKLNEISDGERQKALVARVLVQETPVILLDEPTAHLDLENKAVIFGLLKELTQKENKIVIVSTHDINLVLKHIHKIWLVDNSKIIEIDKNSNNLLQLFNSEKIIYDPDCQIFKMI